MKHWQWMGVLMMTTELMSPGFASEAIGPVISIPSAAGDVCVEPTPVIRREHMRFLFEQRDATVHQGIRTKRHSLRGCIQCHANRDTQGASIPVNADGEFCQSCHEFAGVTMDCFDCHAATPD